MKTERSFKNRLKTTQAISLSAFYERFKAGVHEVKLSLDGKMKLKDAKPG